ncbi:energy-coupling factor transporter transmembrane protein EcfT [Clostridium sp. cel8]|uniref:energy-coupling factor transporter transmembrane component T family protein n=1 Tax=unclassified Clostridium TaxID=2614128 RepID=UPI0015F563A8|nr:energy-coupling factor transporter transmembrane component T [Clostridium sp. cel8]MBA5850965.1 energy-coupling factor transporter transmembrane protein EcfT [Clostridium sp. cel8]
MKDWLLKKDDYVPEDDSDKFIDKSIFSILGILSRIKRIDKLKGGFMYRVNPILKLLFMILNIVFLSLSRNYIYIAAVDVYFLLLLSTLDAERIKNILFLSILMPVFTLIMLIPSIILGNLINSIMLILKIFGTIIIANIFSSTTKWSHITKSLKVFFVPDIFIFIFDITLKYIYILGEFSLDMFHSLKLKSVGKNNKKYSSITKIMGNLFLKSNEMGSEMYSAMECRGFTGEYTYFTKFKITFVDLIYSFMCIGIIALYFYMRVA